MASQQEDRTHDRVQEPCNAMEVMVASVRSAGLLSIFDPRLLWGRGWISIFAAESKGVPALGTEPGIRR